MNHSEVVALSFEFGRYQYLPFYISQNIEGSDYYDGYVVSIPSFLWCHKIGLREDKEAIREKYTEMLLPIFEEHEVCGFKTTAAQELPYFLDLLIHNLKLMDKQMNIR